MKVSELIHRTEGTFEEPLWEGFGNKRALGKSSSKS